MDEGYIEEFNEAKNVSELFSLVKKVVKNFLGKERSGLMLGLADMGGQPGAFVGAFYPVGSNMIVMNKAPLKVIEATRPEYYKDYTFSILLHEYLHSIGILDEYQTRILSTAISENAFGESHPITVTSKDLTRLFPEVIYASLGWKPSRSLKIDIVPDFDEQSLSYIG